MHRILITCKFQINIFYILIFKWDSIVYHFFYLLATNLDLNFNYKIIWFNKFNYIYIFIMGMYYTNTIPIFLIKNPIYFYSLISLHKLHIWIIIVYKVTTILTRVSINICQYLLSNPVCVNDGFYLWFFGILNYCYNFFTRIIVTIMFSFHKSIITILLIWSFYLYTMHSF